MNVVEDISNESGEHILHLIYCPGCKTHHGFDSRWTFNNDYEKPTFSPSMLINEHLPKRCHSFVTNGQIRFLDDCWHDLKGKTLDLESVEFK